MWTQFCALIGNRFIWLIGQSLVLLLCAGYVQRVYTVNILPDKQAESTFQQSRCFLISKRLSTKGHVVQRYRADFLISYNAKGVQYNRWVSGNGLDDGFLKDATSQEDMLAQFQIGGLYPCWYNPTIPQQVMLLQRNNWYSIFPLILPIALSLLVFYYFLKTLFYCIDGQVIRSRKRRHGSD